MSKVRSRKRREHLYAGLLLAATALLVFHQLALHPSDLLVGEQHNGRNDVTAFFGSSLGYPGQAIRDHGEPPFWLDKGLLGSPWLGNPQAALFYPPYWLCSLFDSFAVISWLIVAHHWFGGLGAYLLCRRYRLSFGGSLVAGAAFLGAPFLIAQTGEGHAAQICVVSWAPWACLAYERLRANRPGAYALMPVVLAMAFFCGHVQECFYLVLILSCFALTDAFARRRRALRGNKMIATWTGVGVMTAMLVAVELVPNYFYTKQAIRAAGVDAATGENGGAGPLNLAQLLDPLVLGGPGNYLGPSQTYWETLCYFGVVPLALALLGLLAAARRRRVARWLAVAGVTFLFALGGDTPLFALLHRYVPGVSMFRCPGRAIFFTSLAISILAAVGWDRVVAGMNRLDIRARNIGAAVIGAIGILLVAAALRFNPPGALEANLESLTDVVARIDWAAPAMLTAVLMFVLALAAGFRRYRWAAIAVVMLCAIDSGWLTHRILATVPRAGLRRESEITRFLAAQPHVGRILAPQELLTDREAVAEGLDKLRRYDPVPLIRGVTAVAASAPVENPATLITGFDRLDIDAFRKPILDLLHVTHLVLPVEEARRLPGWKLLHRGRVVEEVCLRGNQPRTWPFAVYQNETPRSRAFVVGNARPLERDIPIDQQWGELDPEREILLAEDVLPPGERQSPRAVEIAHRSPNRVEMSVELDAPGYLVLTDGYYPGWSARVDGRPSKVLPANSTFRAVALPAGEHSVEFRYFPLGLEFGGTISLLAAALLLWSASSAMRKPRRPRRQTADGQSNESSTDHQNLKPESIMA